jgi:parallel beta-helix repeat protein
MLWAIAFSGTVSVTSAAELGNAIAAAKPGDVIELADGTYHSTGYSCQASGTAQSPIVVRAKNPKMATVRFDALEGFKVSGDYWQFENLVVKGVCADDNNCEHAFHVDGASGFVMRGNVAVDFNAQLKVNAVPPKLPQSGLVEGNEIYDTRARNTANPTTKLDIDSGDDWIVRGNVIHDFEKGQGDNVSYAAFLKCGGLRGIMERNLVLCSRDFTGGTRIGLSLGGGGCAPQFCEPSFDANIPCLEHTDGIVRNNIVVNCSDVGVYVNQSKNSRIDYNTLIATSGIDFRFAMTSGEARGNVLAGAIRNRDGATGMFGNNIENVMQPTFDAMYLAPMMGDLRKKGDLSMLLGKGMIVPVVTDDYCARTRTDPFDLGALQASLGDCGTTMPNPDGGSGNGDGGGSSDSGGGGDGGANGGGSSGGCGCHTSGGADGTVLLVLFALLSGRARRSS